LEVCIGRGSQNKDFGRLLECSHKSLGSGFSTKKTF